MLITGVISQSFSIHDQEVLAHKSVCHANHSCPSDTGSYVCGDLGDDDQCSDDQGKSSSLESKHQNQTISNKSVGWQTYEDSQDGYNIRYPQEWKLVENPVLHRQTGFAASPDDNASPLEETLVSVNVRDATRTLDPTSLQVQSIPLKQYADELIQVMTSAKGEPNILNNEGITFIGEPAWRLDYIHNYLGIQVNYGITIYVAKGEKLYEISFSTPPLKVQDMRPIGEKIIQTFQFTNDTGT